MGIFADMLLAAGLRRHDQHVNHISNSLFGSLPEKLSLIHISEPTRP